MREREVQVLRNARLVGIAGAGSETAGPGSETAGPGSETTGPRSETTGPGAGLVDVVIARGRIVAVAPGADAPVGAEETDLDGRWLLPGLVDHHVHFATWARQRARVDVSSARSARQAAGIIADAVKAGAAARSGTLVARGFQDALWPATPTADLLDRAAADGGQPGLPVAVISHDLHAVWLNAAAAARYGAPHAGLLREADAFAAEQAIDAEAAPRTAGLLADAVAAATARGVTGIVDLQMEDNLAAWRERIAGGVTGLRVRAGLYLSHLESAVERGVRTGDEVPGTGGLLTAGPLKLFSDGSLNTRTALCSHAYGDAPALPRGGYGHAAHEPEALRAHLARAREAGLEIALHAIGDLAVTWALDAFEATGARGSVEHAQLVRPEDVPRFAALGVTASVQPQHAMDDRDVADAVWADRAQDAFPYGALARAGARLAFGSDAPVAPLDPWVAIAAAVARTDDDREPWQSANAVTVEQALAASVAFPKVSTGRPADLVAVERDPFTASGAELRTMPVAFTVCAGQVTHSAL